MGLSECFAHTTHRAAHLTVLLAACGSALASDHSDAPSMGTVLRQDANLTDLHAFVKGGNLVVSLCSNPAIPKSAINYVFPSDVTFEINIDTHSAVLPEDNSLGGTILDPDKVRQDVTVRVRFREDGSPRVQVLAHNAQMSRVEVANFFAGLRDDPFIRGPRQGRNVGAIVVELPLADLTTTQSTLLIWGTSKVAEFDGPFQDLAGRSLRSMMPENSDMNTMSPRHQKSVMGVMPDVMIFDTLRPAFFPNGRALEDDVIDMVGDARVLGNDAPFPTTNDLPFLPEFPYLAPPHAP